MMTRDEARAILKLPEEEAIDVILDLAAKAERDEKADVFRPKDSEPGPTTPSGMKPVYLKPPGKKRKRKPGQKKGHKGVSRPRPEKIDHYKEHTICNCPDCNNKLGNSIKSYKRYTEEIPPVEVEVTEHTVYGYWCSGCKKIVYAKITDALSNSALGLRLVVFTAWLHYFIGVSVNNIIKLLGVVARFKVSAGGLTQAWKNLACLLYPVYDKIGNTVAKVAVLHADETGWRINGKTHWLWCFASKYLCYYIIDKSRGSPVVKKVLGKIFNGILCCDFWGAYNRLKAWAKQRCLYHLFTEFLKIDKRNNSSAWKAFRKKLSRLLKDAIRLFEKKENELQDEKRNVARFYERLDLLLEFNSDDKDVKRLIKRLRRHRNEIFTFLEFDGVSPYNNYSEQNVRGPVITRKISHQNRSDAGAKTQAVLMSLFKSAVIQKLNPVDVVLDMAKKHIDKNITIDNELKMCA